ncbi:MAG: cytochrome C oxidase subunit IV family protein [Gemmatimonadaceae bacterium]|nr:cytochrome C oxidase subunit IV family protein [Gemmatimonadaceae bacterium]
MAADHSHPLAHDEHGNVGPHEHAHPDWGTYKWVALILGLITALEVWIYYIPSFTATKMFVPTLLVLSAVKFTIVVMFYMHLKYDAKLFRALFVAPLMLASFIIVGLLFLFGHLTIHF